MPKPRLISRLACWLCISLFAQSLLAENSWPPLRFIPTDQLHSSTAGLSQDLRQLNSEPDLNPASLWLEQGRQSWQTPPASGQPSCQQCHGDWQLSMRGVASRYPEINTKSLELHNLDQQINYCRTQRQHQPAWPAETDELLAMSALISKASTGMGYIQSASPPMQSAILQGEQIYRRRQGQMNLACTHCHDQHQGRQLGGETISQGHPMAYPAYRFEWQKIGSLQRRLRACYFAIRAEPPAFGSRELLQLEAYLVWRAYNLKLEAPGVRR